MSLKPRIKVFSRYHRHDFPAGPRGPTSRRSPPPSARCHRSHAYTHSRFSSHWMTRQKSKSTHRSLPSSSSSGELPPLSEVKLTPLPSHRLSGLEEKVVPSDDKSCVSRTSVFLDLRKPYYLYPLVKGTGSQQPLRIRLAGVWTLTDQQKHIPRWSRGQDPRISVLAKFKMYFISLKVSLTVALHTHAS